VVEEGSWEAQWAGQAGVVFGAAGPPIEGPLHFCPKVWHWMTQLRGFPAGVSPVGTRRQAAGSSTCPAAAAGAGPRAQLVALGGPRQYGGAIAGLGRITIWFVYRWEGRGGLLEEHAGARAEPLAAPAASALGRPMLKSGAHLQGPRTPARCPAARALPAAGSAAAWRCAS